MHVKSSAPTISARNTSINVHEKAKPVRTAVSKVKEIRKSYSQGTVRR